MTTHRTMEHAKMPLVMRRKTKVMFARGQGMMTLALVFSVVLACVCATIITTNLRSYDPNADHSLASALGATPKGNLSPSVSRGMPRSLPKSRCAIVHAQSGKKIIISGAPASGKGTQCQLIVEKFGVKHISTGDALRSHVRGGTDLGKQAKAFMDAGDLVPDELIMKIMEQEATGGSSGWLLDGVPRTAAQVTALNEVGLMPEKVILLEVPDDVLIERCVGRLFDPETGNTYHRKYFPPPADIASRCVQRSDDNEETMKNRIEQFKKNRQSLVDGYKGQIVAIDGNREKEAIFKDICQALA
eukprot:CAMPEP_0197523068 /NCGR_PEP_ID=MMETSP1318-20131121/8082_1 /TAXON_ID=552666 /ORGANISM="Partenskyella glossopodia, Strain RCC365" /LENGTH=301 /DNA_ID=CAMNT_0043075641 /DNA_START=15 /DNA_END=920 /DNA_ORIENTATION=+